MTLPRMILFANPSHVTRGSHGKCVHNCLLGLDTTSTLVNERRVETKRSPNGTPAPTPMSIDLLDRDDGRGEGVAR